MYAVDKMFPQNWQSYFGESGKFFFEGMEMTVNIPRIFEKYWSNNTPSRDSAHHRASFSLV
jgi:hypothetical protein